jgi:hypothetical protein
VGGVFDSLPDALMDEVYDLCEQAIADGAAFSAKEGAAAVLQADDRAHEGRLMAEAAGGFTAAARQPIFVARKITAPFGHGSETLRAQHRAVTEGSGDFFILIGSRRASGRPDRGQLEPNREIETGTRRRAVDRAPRGDS